MLGCRHDRRTNVVQGDGRYYFFSMDPLEWIPRLKVHEFGGDLFFL
jgi:hypothetical protein